MKKKEMIIIAKGNQKFIHPLAELNIVNPARVKDVKTRDRIRKERKRREKKLINLKKFKRGR